MELQRFHSLDALAPYAEAWDRLATASPFCSWSWLSTWWRHYGPQNADEARRRRLHVLGLFDDRRQLVALAPWYLHVTARGGRTLRMLGSGEVCTDYVTLLCHEESREAAVSAVAESLLTPESPRWDRLELTGVDAEDRACGQLGQTLAEAGARLDRRPGLNCWRIALPGSIDDYFKLVTKTRRQQYRKLQRTYLDPGRAQLHRAENAGELAQAMAILVDLHQRRRQSLGDPGCFASPRFKSFFDEVVPAMFREGRVQLYWMEVDGRPIAAEFLLAGGGILYAYQAGIDPESLRVEPGKLIYLAMLERAIGEGFRAFDLLRGNEAYKAQLGAAPRAMVEIRIAARHASAQLRHGLWLAGKGVKNWLKQRVRRETSIKAAPVQQ